jgi:dolichyl-phosphate beta-glucosyltransferase
VPAAGDLSPKPIYSTILVVPCYNEEKRLDIDAYKRFLAHNDDFFLVFVNDGSGDRTEHVLDAFGRESERVVFISLGKNAGKAEAVRQGILYCFNSYDFNQIGFIDADLSTPLEEFIFFKDKLQSSPGITMILGSRIQMLGKDIQRNLVRHWFSRIMATAVGKVLNEPVYDTQCGAKLFKKDTAGELFEKPFLTKWLFDVELLARYKYMHGSSNFKKTILEIAVNNWTEKPNSKLRYADLFRMLFDLRKIRNHYFKRK